MGLFDASLLVCLLVIGISIGLLFVYIHSKLESQNAVIHLLSKHVKVLHENAQIIHDKVFAEEREEEEEEDEQEEQNKKPEEIKSGGKIITLTNHCNQADLIPVSDDDSEDSDDSDDSEDEDEYNDDGEEESDKNDICDIEITADADEFYLSPYESKSDSNIKLIVIHNENSEEIPLPENEANDFSFLKDVEVDVEADVKEVNADESHSPVDYKKMSVNQLREIAKSRGLDHKLGKKELLKLLV